MLLDKYVLTKGLTTLLSHSAPTASASVAAQAGFLKRVNQSMGRLDPLLKTLQVRPSPPEGLVQAYLIHIADRSDTNFRKILELKGVRRQDYSSLIELFGIHRDGKSNEHLIQSSPLLTPLMQPNGLGISGPGTSSHLATGSLSGMSNLQQSRQSTRFDPAGLGEKLFSAARDGVERMGATASTPGPNGDRSGIMSPTEDSKAVNLKSIGKFFRRDISPFTFEGKLGGLREWSRSMDEGGN